MIRRLSACLVTAVLAGGCTMPVESFRAAAYSEIARAQMAAGDPAGAHDTAVRAVTVIADTDTTGERVFGIPAAAIAHLRAGNLDSAETMIESIDKDDGLAFGYVVLAIALTDSGHAAQARQAASHALQTAENTEDEKSRDGMTVYAAWAQAVTGDIRAALGIAESLQDRKQRNGLLSLIAEVQLETGDIAGARITAGSIDGDQTKSDDELWLFSRIVRGLAVDPIAAFDDLVAHSELPLKTALLTRIAVAQAQAGDSDSAHRSFVAAVDAAGGAGPSQRQVRSVGTVALDRAHTGDVAGAVALLDDAERKIAEGANDAVEAPVYLQIVRIAIAGRSVVAELAADARQADDENLLIATMAHIQLGNAGHAETDLEAAAAQMRGNNLSMLSAAYASLAQLWLARHDRAKARVAALQSLAVADRIAERNEDKVLGLYFAAVALARVGDIRSALAAAERIRKPTSP